MTSDPLTHHATAQDSPIDASARRPADLPEQGYDSPRRFWRANDGVDALADPRPYGQENALQKLGRPPFEKSAHSKFRVLGYLATVYEHVARDTGSQVEQAPPQS